MAGSIKQKIKQKVMLSALGAIKSENKWGHDLT